MTSTTAVFLSLLLVTSAAAHERGAEYTYLSMFLRPPRYSSPDSLSDPGQGYSGFTQASRRRLHSTSGSEEMVKALEDEARVLSRAQTGEWSSGDDEEESEEDELSSKEQDVVKVPRVVKTAFGEHQGNKERGNSTEGSNEEEGDNDEIEKGKEGEGGDTEQDESDNETEGTSDSREGPGNSPERKDEPSAGKEDSIPEATRSRRSMGEFPGFNPKASVHKVREKKRQESPSGESGQSDELRDDLKPYERESHRNGEDIQRLSSMLMKLLKQYKITSLADVPCRAHSHWMPIFLKHVAKRRKEAFRYYCVDTNREVLRTIKKRVGRSVSAKFVLSKFWRESLPKADVVFSWGGLDNMREENVVRYIQKLANSGGRHQLIMIGSHSGKLEKEGSTDAIARYTLGGRPINLRREPFGLKRPMRIVGALSKGGNDKQLYIYKPHEMMPDWGER